MFLDYLTEITPEQENLLKKWELLSPKQNSSFLALMDSITPYLQDDNYNRIINMTIVFYEV